MLKPDHLSRLFYGQLKKGGLLSYLTECHKEVGCIKSRTLVQMFSKMMDNNKCHQVEEVKNIWNTQKPKFIQECRFDVIINQEKSLKESVFVLLAVYLEGKLFTVDDLIKDPIAAHKYTIFTTNKKKVQTSFISSGGSPFRSDYKNNLQMSKSAIFGDLTIDPNYSNKDADNSFISMDKSP